MESDELFILILASILALAITIWIFYEIIRSATNAKEQTKLLKTQVKLLAHLLVQQGMDKDRVNKICDPEYKKPEEKELVPV